ncbi:hypothetical protein ASG87_10490 [Frateuria sp. Soil773]|uniref:DUF6491 family protein n=1 Tax=Frateuria sp. Soil773 TaxID=1736407 RepID=UPI0006FFDB85|nr:DUF6491 family protein [Frateuria sp. Soil773]KRF01925.1 hypothetical protein ASG87_10490 [Frateuria sp. Soil773]
MKYNRPWLSGAGLAGLLALLAACSGVPRAQQDSQRQAAYAAAAGAPVRSFRFFTLYSWEPLGRDRLAVYTRPNEAWLLDVGGCTDLEFTQAIGLTSNLHEVSVGFDKVLTGRRDFPCTIRQIRPVDVAKLKAVQHEQRRIEAAARPVSQS